jgi:hypothetical protein
MPTTNAAWSSPEADLSAADFCAVCLIDDNPPGQAKVKGLCWLPIKSTPGGPVNANALQNASGRIFQLKGASAAGKAKAARTLLREMRAAGMEVGSASLLRLAGEPAR